MSKVMLPTFAAAPEAVASPLGRTSPLVKLGVAGAWLIALVAAVDVRAPLLLAALAIAAGMAFGGIPARRLAAGIAPLALAACGIALFNGVFAAVNVDPSQVAVAWLGPARLTEAGLVSGVALGARLLAIAAVGVVFGQTTDSTHLADALVQQARVSPRFAYGALAAYQAVPRFAEDLATIRQARRIRGLPGSWRPGILVALLVQAIRHGDRLALAMDARAFGAGPRTSFRPRHWSALDFAVGALGAAAAIAAAILTHR